MPEHRRCYRLAAVPIAHPPCATLGRNEVEELGVKLTLGIRKGWGDGAFAFVFISYYPTFLLIGNKLN